MQMRRLKNTFNKKKKENKRENKEMREEVLGIGTKINPITNMMTEVTAVTGVIEETEETEATEEAITIWIVNKGKLNSSKKMKRNKRNFSKELQGRDLLSSIPRKVRAQMIYLKLNQKKKQEQYLRLLNKKNNNKSEKLLTQKLNTLLVIKEINNSMVREETTRIITNAEVEVNKGTTINNKIIQPKKQVLMNKNNITSHHHNSRITENKIMTLPNNITLRTSLTSKGKTTKSQINSPKVAKAGAEAVTISMITDNSKRKSKTLGEAEVVAEAEDMIEVEILTLTRISIHHHNVSIIGFNK